MNEAGEAALPVPLARAKPAPARDKKLGDWLYEQILERILHGVYRPRTRLPSETALAAEFDVSRPVVRQALARLRDDDLLTSRQGSGSWVKHRPDEAVLRFAPLAGLNDVQRCFEFRLGLEGRAAGLAAARRDEAALAAIRQAFDTLEQVIVTGRLGVDADYEFHLAVSLATGNRYFPETIKMLREHIQFGMNITRNLSLRQPLARLRLVQDEHRRVLDAIAAGDEAAAEQAMLTHVDNARRRMFEGDPGA
jgi:DNA-binding FadR family transcriptional regulator